MSKELLEYRSKIDEIDEQLIKLFAERMDVAEDMAAYKKANKIPVLDLKRERAVIQRVIDLAPEKYRDYAPRLISYIMELSRSYQHQVNNENLEVANSIAAAIENTPKLFPDFATVACQGVEGANSHIACDKLFKHANITYFPSFKDLFTAVEQGVCKYAVIPLENSTAGSVTAVYDLMMHHKFKIVRSIRLKIEHNLLVKPGTKLEDVKEIYSHPQAINQSGDFLNSLEGVKVIPCENTAMAAKKVAESDRNDLGALSSMLCMKYYGLECVKSCVQDQDNNYTRFIVISKELEIYPGADKTSVMATLPHEAGALYKLLSRINALGIDLHKLESRPIPEKEFQFMFYLDLVMPIYSPEIPALMSELHEVCENFTYLGTYSEVL